MATANCSVNHHVLQTIGNQLQTTLPNVTCELYPGHNEFIPVNDFKNDHFPVKYRENKNIYNLTKALCDITVKINVNYVSPSRPKIVPSTTSDSYPGYGESGTAKPLSGTGRVWGVTKYTEQDDNICKNPKCEHTSGNEKVWWKIEVRTSCHVVYDELEVKELSCRLWFDEEDSPEVNISGLQMAESDAKGDWCVFYCVTHDAEVGNKLEKMMQRFDDLNEQLLEIYSNKRLSERLTIIVSHPHGCSKQVSVGHWINQESKQNDDNFTRFFYNTSTCPGSSGSCVYRLGWRSPHPHYGRSGEGSNVSAWFGDLAG